MWDNRRDYEIDEALNELPEDADLESTEND
jgi:hypothetical protein